MRPRRLAIEYNAKELNIFCSLSTSAARGIQTLGGLSRATEALNWNPPPLSCRSPERRRKRLRPSRPEELDAGQKLRSHEERYGSGRNVKVNLTGKGRGPDCFIGRLLASGNCFQRILDAGHDDQKQHTVSSIVAFYNSNYVSGQ